MTTSGVYGFNPTVGELILEAYELLQVASQGETLSGDMFRAGKNSLNYLLRKMQTDGIHLWTYTEGTLFLQVGQAEYDFGDPDTHVVNTFFETALSNNADAGDTTIFVDDFSNLQEGDAIGIITQENNLFWTTIAATVGSSTITLSEGLDLTAGVGAIVYSHRSATLTVSTTVLEGLDGVAQFHYAAAVTLVPGQTVTLIDFNANEYAGLQTVVTVGDGFFTTGLSFISISSGNFVVTTETLIPVSRLTPNGVRRRESTDFEIPIFSASKVDYTDLPNKSALGQPIQAYYERSIRFGKMFLWTAPSSSVPVINFTYERQLQQVINASETLDVAEEYHEAIIYNLARRLLPKEGASADLATLIIGEAERSYDEALGYDNAVYPITMDMDFYGQSDH